MFPIESFFYNYIECFFFLSFLLQIYIDRLKRENEEMSVKLRFYERDRISKQDSSEIETSEECRTEERKSSNEEIFVTTKASAETQTSVSVTDEQEEASCALEPLKKLETRFKDTMEKLAELTDEKQQLEHLVLQLQGETETIGIKKKKNTDIYMFESLIFKQYLLIHLKNIIIFGKIYRRVHYVVSKATHRSARESKGERIQFQATD